MRKSVAASAVLVVCAMASWSTFLAADTWNRTHRRTTTAGKEVLLAAHTAFNDQCERIGTGYPGVTTSSPPSHGTIDFRKTVHAVGARGMGGRAHRCFAIKMPGIGIYYKPKTGFRGTDRVSYSVHFPTGWIFRDSAIITVY